MRKIALLLAISLLFVFAFAAAEKADVQEGVYTIYNVTGEKVTSLTLTDNVTGESTGNMLGEDGLPAQIVSHFSGSNARIVEKGMNLLAAPVKFCETAGQPTCRFAFTECTPAHAAWKSEAKIAGGITRIVEGRIDFAGACQFRIRQCAFRQYGDDLHMTSCSNLRHHSAVNGVKVRLGKNLVC